MEESAPRLLQHNESLITPVPIWSEEAKMAKVFSSVLHALMSIRIIQEDTLWNKPTGDSEAGGQKAHKEAQLAKTMLDY